MKVLPTCRKSISFSQFFQFWSYGLTWSNSWKMASWTKIVHCKRWRINDVWYLVIFRLRNVEHHGRRRLPTGKTWRRQLRAFSHQVHRVCGLLPQSAVRHPFWNSHHYIWLMLEQMDHQNLAWIVNGWQTTPLCVRDVNGSFRIRTDPDGSCTASVARMSNVPKVWKSTEVITVQHCRSHLTRDRSHLIFTTTHRKELYSVKHLQTFSLEVLYTICNLNFGTFKNI